MNFGRLLAFAGLLAASLPAAETPIPVLAELQDGSQLRGTLPPLILSVESPVLGRMQVGLDRVASLSCDGPQVKLALRNGDRLAGALTLPELRLQTQLGELTVPLARLRQVETLDADGLPVSLLEHLVWHPRFDQAADGKIPNGVACALETRAVKTAFIPDHRGRTNAAVLLTNGVASVEARGDLGKPLAQTVTISGWIKVEGPRQEEGVCLIAIGSARLPHAGLILSDDEGLMWHCGGNNDNSMRQPLDPSEWTFVAATRDGRVLTVYVNGDQVQTQPAENAPLLGEATLFTIGGFPKAWINPAHAEEADAGDDAKKAVTKIMVGDVRIYSRALGAEEIRRVYQATRK